MNEVIVALQELREAKEALVALQHKVDSFYKPMEWLLKSLRANLVFTAWPGGLEGFEKFWVPKISHAIDSTINPDCKVEERKMGPIAWDGTAARIYAVAVKAQATIEGMKALNTERERNGYALAYSEQAFLDVAMEVGRAIEAADLAWLIGTPEVKP